MDSSSRLAQALSSIRIDVADECNPVRGMLSGMTRNAKRPNERRPNQLRNKLRIIAGRWRGMPIEFPTRTDLRPTPDRVRETLFNWLQPAIVDARCLDLFAGSGALGFEALSRGAREVVCVDHDRDVVQQLQSTAERLRAAGFEAVARDALEYLQQSPRPFDIVFLDPPYASDCVREILPRLSQGWLAREAFVYVELPADAGTPPLPSTWSVHRSKSAGQVGYHLLRAVSSEGRP